MAALTVTKKVRLDRATAARLKLLAARMHTTESAVIRDALERLDQSQDRQKTIQRLQELLGPEEPKIRFRLK